MTNISLLFKNSGYAVVFGFIGFITGIWTADLFYRLFLKHADRVMTTYISVFLIVVIAAAAAYIGFTQGKKLLESDSSGAKMP